MEPPADSGATQANSGVSATAIPSHKATNTEPENDNEPHFPNPTSVTPKEAPAATKEGPTGPTATTPKEAPAAAKEGPTNPTATTPKEAPAAAKEGPTNPTTTAPKEAPAATKKGPTGPTATTPKEAPTAAKEEPTNPTATTPKRAPAATKKKPTNPAQKRGPHAHFMRLLREDKGWIPQALERRLALLPQLLILGTFWVLLKHWTIWWLMNL